MLKGNTNLFHLPVYILEFHSVAGLEGISGYCSTAVIQPLLQVSTFTEMFSWVAWLCTSSLFCPSIRDQALGTHWKAVELLYLYHGLRKCSENICETKWNMAPFIYALCKRKPQGDVSRDTPALIFP